MSEDTLNERFFNTINTVYGDKWLNDYVANECERICIEQQIILVNEVANMYVFNEIREFEKQLGELQQSLTNKLNSIK